MIQFLYFYLAENKVLTFYVSSESVNTKLDQIDTRERLWLSPGSKQVNLDLNELACLYPGSVSAKGYCCVCLSVSVSVSLSLSLSLSLCLSVSLPLSLLSVSVYPLSLYPLSFFSSLFFFFFLWWVTKLPLAFCNIRIWLDWVIDTTKAFSLYLTHFQYSLLDEQVVLGVQRTSYLSAICATRVSHF